MADKDLDRDRLCRRRCGAFTPQRARASFIYRGRKATKFDPKAFIHQELSYSTSGEARAVMLVTLRGACKLVSCCIATIVVASLLAIVPRALLLPDGSELASTSGSGGADALTGAGHGDGAVEPFPEHVFTRLDERGDGASVSRTRIDAPGARTNTLPPRPHRPRRVPVAVLFKLHALVNRSEQRTWTCDTCLMCAPLAVMKLTGRVHSGAAGAPRSGPRRVRCRR
jgi:hypothetical protein